MRLLAGLLSAVGLGAAFLFYEFYWRWRDCFNELGHCFDPTEGVVYQAQSGLVWGSAALVLLVAGVVASILGQRK